MALYGSRYTIVFEDGEKNRFLKNVEYTMEKLMIPGKFLRFLLPMGPLGLELDFYLCDSDSGCREEPSERIVRELRIAASRDADPEVKRELHLRILQYYFDMDDMQALDRYLKEIPPEGLLAQERASVVRFMVLRGNYKLAWEWLESYGPYFVDVKILVRLVGAMIEKYDMAENPLLTAAATHIFRRGI